MKSCPARPAGSSSLEKTTFDSSKAILQSQAIVAISARNRSAQVDFHFDGTVCRIAVKHVSFWAY
jgi:hypothetical protein